MSKELMYLHFVQIVIVINTLILFLGVLQARKGNIALHKKINGIAVGLTFIGIIGLVATIGMGWDYLSLTTPLRMTIHRSFSSPLLILLILTTFFGIKENRKWHMRCVYTTIPFWLGTLVTGVMFF